MKHLALLLILGATALAQDPPNTIRYTIMLAGNAVGYSTATQKADGTIEIHYEFNDRGRGPKVTETIKVDTAGVPVQMHAAGNDYLKAAVEETLTFGLSFKEPIGWPTNS